MIEDQRPSTSLSRGIDGRKTNLLEWQELQQRVKFYCVNRGSPEHWLFSGIFKRVELQKALGNSLSWKER
ncbi:unnamed protein product [Ilex paraguariensis]|uniref:Uncharacterized protein n=1 Tax=Ilex paraguariensis TaxID=185542 RepID=A0ABC8TS44_9AQUA